MKVKLKKYIDQYGDGIHGTPEYNEDGEYFFINGNNLENGKIVINKDTLRITRDEYEKIKRPLNSNTILLSINGSLGKIAVYDNERVALGKSACYLNVNKNENKYFVKYVLSTKEFQKYMIHVAHGSTIKNLAPSQVVDYEFEEPEDKDKIALILKLIDDKIENNRRIITAIEQMTKTIYDYWFLQYEFLNEKEKPYKTSGGKMVWNDELKKEIPEGWKYKKIVEIENNIVTGKTPSTKDEGNFNGNIPFITIDDIRQGLYVANTIRTLSEKGASSQSKKYIPKDTICVTCIATVGLVGITTKDSQTNQQINSIVCENKNNLYYLVNAINDYFEYSNGAKSGNIFDNMNKEDFASIKIIYPTEDVLEKFKEKVDPIYSKIRSCILENEELVKLRDYLLPLLMNEQVGF